MNLKKSLSQFNGSVRCLLLFESLF